MSQFKKHWRDFASRPPGKRFQEIHKNKAKDREKRSPVMRHVRMIAGVLLTLGGVFLLAVPGPGTVVMAVGLAMVAGESVTVARFLDWLEVKLRALYQRLRRVWKGWSKLQRALVATAVVVVLGTIGSYAFYLLVMH